MATTIRDRFDLELGLADGDTLEFRSVTGANLARALIRGLGEDVVEVRAVRRTRVRWQDLPPHELTPAEVAELLRPDPHDGFNYV